MSQAITRPPATTRDDGGVTITAGVPLVLNREVLQTASSWATF